MGSVWDCFGRNCTPVTLKAASFYSQPQQPFTDWFPRADVNELIAPDLLHQIIKGGFKDHLVQWVEDYLILVHGEAGAAHHMSDIDQRFAHAQISF